jgi:hypothetical protein
MLEAKDYPSRTPLSIAPHSVLMTMNSPAVGPPFLASVMASSPSFWMVSTLSM